LYLGVEAGVFSADGGYALYFNTAANGKTLRYGVVVSEVK